MGRPRNGVPYLKGGVYHIRFKGDKDPTSLNTRSARDATRIGRTVAAKRNVMFEGGPAEDAFTRPIASPAPSTAAPSVTVQPVEGMPAPSEGAPAGDALSSWLGSESEFHPSPNAPRTSPAAPQQELWSSGATTLAPSVKTSLSAEERSRLHGLLSGVVGRVNVMVLGMGVRIFGRIPAEPEPADMELLNKAWQLQLDELLADKEVKPYMLIIAASAGLGIGMYAGGDPIPPKPKAGPVPPGPMDQ